MFSTSDLEEDMRRALELGADGYQVKPFGHEKLVLFAQQLREMVLNSEKKKGNG
jgi:DNA-binding response OmpR family regulator